MKKTKCYVNKAVYLGICVFLSCALCKTLMYDFHYNYIKIKYRDDARLLFTDTDSLAYDIKTEDFYKDIISAVEKRLTVVTTQLIIHVVLKPELIAKRLESLRMKMAVSRF